MSQINYDILGSENPGTVLKTKIDQYAAALNSMNSGSTAPPNTYAFMLWMDTSTTPAILKQRNSTDSGWIVIGVADNPGWMRTNAGNPNGSVTGNFAGQLLYDTTNNVLYTYSGSGTVWYAQQSANNASLASPGLYHDMRIVWIDANTIRILAGSRCRSLDNTRDIVFDSDYNILMTNATPTFSQGGRTVPETANTFYHLYIGLDSSNRPIAWLDTANLADGGIVTNPAAFSSGRRQIRLSIPNNASSNLRPFSYRNNRMVEFPEISTTADYVVFSGGLSTAWVPISVANYIPVTAQNADFFAENIGAGTGTLYLRPVGLEITSGAAVAIPAGFRVRFGRFIGIYNSQVEYRVDGALSAGLLVYAYEITQVP